MKRAATVLALCLALTAWGQDEPPPSDPPVADVPGDDETPPDDDSVGGRPMPIPEQWFAGSAADLAAAHAHVTLETIGRSAGGRPIEALTVASRGGGDTVWVVLVIAHADGARPLQETRCALNLAAWLAEHEEGLPAGTAVCVIPDLNPDASARAAVFPRAGNDTPVDEDRDGDIDEDGPDDLDGDGRIGWMYVPDPGGDVRVEPHSVQEGVFVGKRADVAKGVLPTHRRVPEGRDDDGDGALNEDGPGGVSVARNFTWKFEEHSPGAGMWPASESETRALIDHVLADQRIALVYEIGGNENVHGKPGANDVWQKQGDGDAATYDALRELHPKPEDKDLLHGAHAPGAGSPGGAVAHMLGRLWLGRSLSGKSYADAKEIPDEAEVRALAVGAVPAGSYASDVAPEQPGTVFPTTAVKESGAFLLAAAAARPAVVFSGTEVSGERGVLRLRTRLANGGHLPTHTERGAELRSRRPLNVRIEVPGGATLLAGDPLVQIERLAGGASSDELAWVVTGTSGSTVRVTCTGPDTGTVTLEETIP